MDPNRIGYHSESIMLYILTLCRVINVIESGLLVSWISRHSYRLYIINCGVSLRIALLNYRIVWNHQFFITFNEKQINQPPVRSQTYVLKQIYKNFILIKFLANSVDISCRSGTKIALQSYYLSLRRHCRKGRPTWCNYILTLLVARDVQRVAYFDLTSLNGIRAAQCAANLQIDSCLRYRHSQATSIQNKKYH